MKQIKFLIVAVLLSFLANVSVGQSVKFGLEAGLNLSNFSGDADMDAKLGYQGGLYAEHAFSDHYSIRLSLLTANKGAKIEEDGVTMKYALNYIELKPMVIRKFALGNLNLTGGLGVYYAPFASGTLRANKKVLGPDGDSKTESINMGSGDNDMLKSTDFGLSAMAGVDLKDFGTIGVQYEMGLANISNMDGTDVKNSSFSIFYAIPF